MNRLITISLILCFSMMKSMMPVRMFWTGYPVFQLTCMICAPLPSWSLFHRPCSPTSRWLGFLFCSSSGCTYVEIPRPCHVTIHPSVLVNGTTLKSPAGLPGMTRPNSFTILIAFSPKIVICAGIIKYYDCSVREKNPILNACLKSESDSTYQALFWHLFLKLPCMNN